MALKALILEDDRQVASSLKEVFIQRGLDTHTSYSVKQAKYILAFQHYDLILVDLIMPEITGVDFIKDLVTQQLVSKDCTLWLMSGILSPSSLPNKVKTRINHFFKKPLDFNIINQQLDILEKPQNHPFPKNVQALYMQNDISRDTKYLLDASESIHSHELMFIYFILNLSQFTGCLNIQYQKSDSVKVFLKTETLLKYP